MKLCVLTSDHHSWLLKGFLHQWNKYGRKNFMADGMNDALELEVAGFTRPDWLPGGIPFYSIGKFEDYPVEKWSDGLIKYLQGLKEELVLILLEDYWMLRPVNRAAIFNAFGYMEDHPDVIRFDVASDRMFCQAARHAGYFGNFDLCEGKGAYALSFQASIFRKDLLLQMLRPGETPWQAELEGSARVNRSEYRVVGTYQWPMNYMIVVNKGHLDRTGDWMYPSRSLSKADWLQLDNLGYTTQPEDFNVKHAL
jgi:hypothetical protein